MDETTSSTKTKVVAIFLLLFLIALGLGVMYSRNLNQSKKTTSEETKQTSKTSEEKKDKSDIPPTNEPTLSIGSTELMLSSDTANPKLSTPFKVSVNTSGTAIVSADLIVKYDPKVLEFVSAEKGKIFDLVFENKSDATKGEIKLSASVAADGAEKNTTGEAMIMTFKPIATSTSTQIAIDPTQTIAALKGQNILNKANLKELNIAISN